MDLTNSKRILRSASYVVTELTSDEQLQIEQRSGRALEKLNFIRQITMLPEDIASTREALAQQRTETLEIVSLQNELENLNQVVTALTNSDQGVATNLVLAPLVANIPVSLLYHVAAQVARRANSAVLDFQVEAFQQRLRTAPVGRLHLERIEMYPVGVQRGELMFTVPLAPKETVTISHKEWSTSGEEYERIVNDFFESYSERGVAEKTDVSMSTENESKHASAFNFSSNASGSYGPVSLSISVGLNQNSENREAAKQATQRTREVTEKASARARQEHKISVKLETKRGVEDSSFRTITNPHEDKAIRIDYYRMMRKWRTDLFRYGLRLTFDIAIPNPGARLWALYRQVQDLDKRIQTPFVFPLKIDSLTDDNWPAESAKWGTPIDPPPAKTLSISVSKTLDKPNISIEMFEFDAPEGYTLGVDVKGTGSWVGASQIPGMQLPAPNQLNVIPGVLTSGGTFTAITEAAGGSRHKTVPVIFLAGEKIALTLQIGANRTQESFSAWRQKAWKAMYDTAFGSYQQELALLQAERDQLWMKLASKDTLSLRRLEREEIIRQTLYWLIGWDFDPTPGKVSGVVKKLVNIEQSQLPDEDPNASDTLHRLTKEEWGIAAGFGDFVKYIHHAVEWENLLYFLYPYFWGSDDIAREKMLFEHPDPNHRDFLRAGYARIVVPIRSGFEESFTRLLDTGIFDNIDTTPYITIAEEVAAYARTNYASVPPANPEKHARPLLYPQQRKTWETMQKVIALIETYYESNKVYPTDLSVLAGAPFKDAWGRELVYKNPGSGNDYDLLSLGVDGKEGGEDLDADISAAATSSLIASWFDYTPTSGIDIEIDTKTENLA